VGERKDIKVLLNLQVAAEHTQEEVSMLWEFEHDNASMNIIMMHTFEECLRGRREKF
jgi:hypothetical protein